MANAGGLEWFQGTTLDIRDMCTNLPLVGMHTGVGGRGSVHTRCWQTYRNSATWFTSALATANNSNHDNNTGTKQQQQQQRYQLQNGNMYRTR